MHHRYEVTDKGTFIMTEKQPDTCCILTGVTGWLGRHIVQELEKSGCEIYVLLRQKNGLDVHGRCKEFEQETGFKSRLKPLEIIDNQIPELPAETTHIIHCAAMVDFSDDKNIFQANVGLTWDLLVATSQLSKFERFLYISTFSIRGNGRKPFTENSLDVGQDFISAYNLTKFLAETVVKKFHKDVNSSIIRLGSILGRSDGYFPMPSDWFYRTIKLWLEGKSSAFPLGMNQEIHPLPVDIASQVLCTLLYYPELPEILHLPHSPGPEMTTIFKEMAMELNRPSPGLYSQHSEEWRTFRKQLAPTVRRMIDGLYPPPPNGAELVTVNSDISKKWFTSNNIDIPETDSTYWRCLARYINNNCKSRT
jgi:nucleoside-diphosphate-sugar epimerase